MSDPIVIHDELSRWENEGGLVSPDDSGPQNLESHEEDRFEERGKIHDA